MIRKAVYEMAPIGSRVINKVKLYVYDSFFRKTIMNNFINVMHQL
jgi:hypothetical protein